MKLFWAFTSFQAQIVILLFLHNSGVLNSNLPDAILYVVFFTFKLTKNEMAAKM